MDVSISSAPPPDSGDTLVCIGLFAGDELPADLADAPGAVDVRAKFKSLSVLRPEGRRVLVVGLGERDDFDSERARVAAALAVRQAQRLETAEIAWDCPEGGSVPAAIAGATILASYRFDQLKSSAADDDPDPELSALTLHGASDATFAAGTVPVAVASARAANRARDLQNLPANICDPAFLGDRALEIAAANERIEARVLGGAEIAAEGLGGLLAVSAGSVKEPALITLRYRGSEAGPTLGFVGKGVTFDTGGISIKPSAGMELMKKDMSGGAAVLEATAAIAELGLPVDLIAVVPAVENMPSGSATRPGDVITQLNGRTVEVNNTDAEGRLILADALTWAIREGAERLVDIATLTGAVIVALGSSYAGLVSNDDAWAEEVAAAGAIVGELAWRLPLHQEYKDLMRGTTADLTNSAPKRKAGTITAASFLEEFVEGVTWAHLDIAGTSWDVGREYVGKGATGFGTRLLIELARNVGAPTG
ncbi:MAG: leucyl aminopeptidase [Solirubrobacterales bacterium]|nr:leucyl aminopeptidase [Solirubrobacterales bacterium]MCB8969445.1 leucyl aminopeptidase [Thermoleophilales bacterium]